MGVERQRAPERPPEGAEPATSVRVRYFAGARSAAGVAEETVRVRGSGGTATVADVVEELLSRYEGRLSKVVPACSFLVDGVAVREHGTVVPEGCEFDVLPPFAGG